MNAQGTFDLFESKRARARVPDLDSPPLAPPRARNSDPTTSHAAAVKAMGNAKGQRTALWGVLMARGAHGANASECDEALGWPASSSGRRLGEMAKAPRPCIVPVPEVERLTASGNRGIVYVAEKVASTPCPCAECVEARAYVQQRKDAVFLRRGRARRKP